MSDLVCLQWTLQKNIVVHPNDLDVSSKGYDAFIAYSLAQSAFEDQVFVIIRGF